MVHIFHEFDLTICALLSIISKLQSDDKKFSFHYPLHRYFSVFLRQAIKYQGFAPNEGMYFSLTSIYHYLSAVCFHFSIFCSSSIARYQNFIITDATSLKLSGGLL